jgi:8-oxo-dGTP diphosphatase
VSQAKGVLITGVYGSGKSSVAAEIAYLLEQQDRRFTLLDLFGHVMHNSSGGGRVAFFFTSGDGTESRRTREPHKCSELRRAPLNALPANLVDYCRTALAAIAEGKPFSLSGWQNGPATGTAAL